MIKLSKEFLRSITQDRDELIAKVFALSEEYGCNQIFLAFSRPENHHQDRWVYKANADLEVLVDFLEEVVIPTLKSDDVV